MSLAEELLEHARFLATLDPRVTTQANIRRAISAAYYAVFHLLAAEAAAQVSPGVPRGLRERTQRVLEHKQMATAAYAFSQPGGRQANLPPDIRLAEPISDQLALIASTFRELQEARQAADYDVLKRHDPTEALVLVQKAEEIFRLWKSERGSSNADVFLVSLLFGKSWNK
ncbi:MAG: hypothetical protein WCE75_03805 [Terracidiphilus sp.]